VIVTGGRIKPGPLEFPEALFHQLRVLLRATGLPNSIESPEEKRKSGF
jgi:hypothetical protein